MGFVPPYQRRPVQLRSAPGCMMPSSELLAVIRWMILMIALLASAPVWSAPLCLPQPTGIPGEPGAPDWWNVISGRREDPRWCGAMGVGHVGNRGRFQGLQSNEGGTDYLYLSWEIRGGGGGGTQDILYLGFLDPVSGTGTSFKIAIPTDTGVGTVAQQPVAAGQVQWRAKAASGVAWGAWSVSNVNTAPWMQSTGRYWVDCSAACSTYTVMVRIPIDPDATPSDFDLGLDLPSDVLFWYDVQVLQPGSPPTTAHHALPEGHAFSVANFVNPAYPSSSDWAELRLTGSGCETGVALMAGDLSVTHGGSGPDLRLTTDNTIHAAPVNETGGPLVGDGVEARLRLANWGTGGPGDSPTWDDVPGCASASGSGNVADGAGFDLTCDWAPDMATLCAYRPAGAAGQVPPWDACIGPGTLDREQWLLADLSAGAASSSDVFMPVASACTAVEVLDVAHSVPVVSPVGRIVLALVTCGAALYLALWRSSAFDAS